MNRDLIKNFVLRNNYYSFYIENYVIIEFVKEFYLFFFEIAD